jgi:hypothetical protein
VGALVGELVCVVGATVGKFVTSLVGARVGAPVDTLQSGTIGSGHVFVSSHVFNESNWQMRPPNGSLGSNGLAQKTLL